MLKSVKNHSRRATVLSECSQLDKYGKTYKCASTATKYVCTFKHFNSNELKTVYLGNIILLYLFNQC